MLIKLKMYNTDSLFKATFWYLGVVGLAKHLLFYVFSPFFFIVNTGVTMVICLCISGGNGWRS